MLHEISKPNTIRPENSPYNFIATFGSTTNNHIETFKRDTYFSTNMTEYAYDLKIPKQRVAVLIGKKGETKRQIEESTDTKLDIDSKEGEILIKGEDALSLYTVRDIVRAVGRGFNPDIALLLLKQDYSFELVDIKEFVKESHYERIKGRVIGKEGKSRKTIEELTECYISVFGKTIAIIGEVENVSIARRAVESLLSGSPHSSVYKFLEKRRRRMKMDPDNRV